MVRETESPGLYWMTGLGESEGQIMLPARGRK